MRVYGVFGWRRVLSIYFFGIGIGFEDRYVIGRVESYLSEWRFWFFYFCCSLWWFWFFAGVILCGFVGRGGVRFGVSGFYYFVRG